MARKTGWGETLLGLAILAALAGVGTAVYFEQFRPHPAAYSADKPDYLPPPAPRPAAAARPSRVNPPEGMTALGPSEYFDPDTLYEKIDGRAELYLPAGFRSLECRRLGIPGDEDSVVETFLYDMGSPRSAYSVFSQQQREDAEPRDFTRYAYLAENALFFCHGSYYLEIIAGTAAASAREALRKAAAQVMADLPAEPADLPELARLPEAHRLAGHPRLYRTDGLGFAPLTDLFVADYQIGEFQLSGFVCARGSEAEAAKLAQAYQQFIMDDGAMLLPPIPELPDARVLDFYGTWQVLFTRGPYFAGVHQAGDRLSAEQLALLLDRQLSEAAP
ncbi:MAG TPA: hypothetical protein P5567_02210 [Kiritimatiellia bacterium]|nr:hypothetical protein [Kiritimatiellia bacterium]HRZ11247.1 hypothetical protein [Kiritimatiellia bacterium]HSA19098.1 hypothetical protein [Kiritimatiellia bacterium]